jgi:hypothetical protein
MAGICLVVGTLNVSDSASPSKVVKNVVIESSLALYGAVALYLAEEDTLSMTFVF